EFHLTLPDDGREGIDGWLCAARRLYVLRRDGCAAFHLLIIGVKNYLRMDKRVWPAHLLTETKRGGKHWPSRLMTKSMNSTMIRPPDNRLRKNYFESEPWTESAASSNLVEVMLWPH